MDNRQVRVYIADVAPLCDPAFYEAAYKSVSEERKKKADACKKEQDRCLSLGAGLLLDYALKNEGILSYRLQSDARKKPMLVQTVWDSLREKRIENICFNLSHSGERVMCVTAGVQTGCDLEKIRSIPGQMIRTVLSETEYENVRKKETEADRTALFFSYWTRKESYLKATGTGLVRDLSHVLDEAEQNGYYFKSYDLSDGYCYTACAMSPCFDEKLRIVDLYDIAGV